MAIPNTKDGNVRFIIDEPDWESPMEYRVRYETKIIQARDGSEQRIRKQLTPKVSFSYQLANRNADDFSVRRSEQFRELDRLLVVPIWAFEHTGTTPSSTNYSVSSFTRSVTDPSDGEAFGFKVGSYIFFEESGVGNVIMGPLTNVAIGLGPHMSISWGSSTPVAGLGSFPSYTSAAIARPCVAGARLSGAAKANQHRLGWTNEMIAVEEI